jgi:hypothetical protein
MIEIRRPTRIDSQPAPSGSTENDQTNPFPGIVDLADQIATSGRWGALNNAIERLAKSYAGREDVWYLQTLSGLAFLTLTEYNLLKEANGEKRRDTVSLVAWRARNLLELAVWAVYCMGGAEKVRRLYEDAGRDATDMFNAFQKWGEATAQDANFISRFVSAKQDLSQRAATEGIEELNASYMRVASVAKEIGMGDHFMVGFKLLSKWAHPTAMQMLNVEGEEKIHLQRECFFSMGCLHFTGAFTGVENLLLPLAKVLA